ncbi:Disease resistance protein L6 [Linum perenne]
MEKMFVRFGEGTTVPNAYLQSQTSSAEQLSVEYEVFLSFRGPDVRKSFADFLYSYLVRSKIRTFRDEEELRKGEVIAPSLVQAITQSKIYIPILSKSYASSKWCLQELAKMVECCGKGNGHIILPIFYFVDPRDVRHQAGPYEDAFEQHSKKHDPLIVQAWREALQEVGQMKGWHVTEIDGQGAVIDEVFSKVELHLRSNYTLVTEELVGINSHVQEVVRLLNLDSSDGKVVGIQGIGGMGKTTIAKAVYDNVCTSFNRCCFLENIREQLSKTDGIVALQNKLISSILRDDIQVQDASEGVDIIRQRVCKYKVLIILDDVDDRFEFGQILGKLSHFSSESRFIITTRDQRVLELLQEYKLYEPKEMSYGHSLQLFSRHAFRTDYPPEDYATLCYDFVKVAARLPLALKVIGSLLFCRDKQFWEEKLMELKDLPATSNLVQQRLKISYNELTRNEKQIFLDIACFFIGEDKELPVHMWSDCKFYPESGLRTLVLRSLIKIDEENQFWMHDLLRDLGRAIVMEEDVKNPCKRSRIWSYEDAWNMLKNEEVSMYIFMISPQIMESKAFEKLSGLKYLDMAYFTLTGDFSGILPDIRWLRLNQCKSLPTDLNLKKAVILDLQNCYVTDDWRGWSGIQVAHKLKVINLYGCHRLNRVPNLARCESLESIDLSRCFGMTGELNIGSFRNLKVVRFQNTKITNLSGDMGKLQKLQEIRTGTMVWWRAQEIVFPTSLKHLTISSPRISNLLELKELQDLCFETFGHAPEIPGDIWQLTKLKTLQLRYCNFNGGLNRLPNLANLYSLAELGLHSVEITEIHGLGELRMLEVLAISDSSALENLYGLENLVHLKELTLRRCNGLKNLPSLLKNLVQLKELTLEKCGRLENLPSLSNLIKLHSLVIGDCTLLSNIQGLGELRGSLLKLEVYGCMSLTRLPNLSGLKDLKMLSVTDCIRLVDVTGLRGLESLQILRMDRLSVEELLDISGLKNLEQLNVSECKEFIKVTGLEKLEKLRKLTISYCSIKEFPDMSGLKNLLDLTLSGCTKLAKLTGFEKLELLERLEMPGCNSIKELPDMSGLKNLHYLNLDGCAELIKVTGFEKLEKLTMLSISGCKSIKKLPDMSGLENLHHLHLKGCVQLKEVKGLEKLKGLMFVDMDKRLYVKYCFKSASWCKKLLTQLVFEQLYPDSD